MLDRLAEPKIWTIKCLDSLKPGEHFMFYRGNLPLDIRRSPVAAADLLSKINAHAQMLAARGTIRIEAKRIKKLEDIEGESYAVIEYTAHRTPSW